MHRYEYRHLEEQHEIAGFDGRVASNDERCWREVVVCDDGDPLAKAKFVARMFAGSEICVVQRDLETGEESVLWIEASEAGVYCAPMSKEQALALLRDCVRTRLTLPRSESSSS